MTAVEEARQRFRHAVSTGSYAEAQSCLDQYTRAVSAGLETSGPDDPAAADMVTAALELLRWADRAVRSGRAHDAGRLAQLVLARPYRPMPPQPAASFQLDA